MHPELRRKIRLALNDILDDEHCGKALKGELSGLWSLRVGRQRVIYRPDAEGAEIVTIGPRTGIYEETTVRMLRGRRSPPGHGR